MKITQSNYNYKRNMPLSTPSFKAREYLLVDLLYRKGANAMKILRLEQEDAKFIDKMASKIDLKKLNCYPNATENQILKWKNLINNAGLLTGFSKPQETYLLVTRKNKPCGMISYNTFNKETYVDTIVTWPVKEGEKVKYAGKALLKMLFDKSVHDSVKKVRLDVLTDGPMDSRAYYFAHGFFENNNLKKNKVDLYITDTAIADESKKLSEFINLSRILSPKKVDLSKTLDIEF